MCRWNSGLFYHHPALKNTRYYWRVEPKVHFFCDVDYDVFRYMADHNKTYGFTINLYDAPQSIPTLWPETLRFLASHPEYESKNNAREWLTDSKRRPDHNIKANGYSTCHFWSNFEIADMDFWRSKVYEDYFEHLDRAGGFFYERWGDAPVHSIALGLFEDASKIHWYVAHSQWSTIASVADQMAGSATLAINISRTSIAQIHLNARDASRAASQMVNVSSLKKIAGRTGSNMLGRADQPGSSSQSVYLFDIHLKSIYMAPGERGFGTAYIPAAECFSYLAPSAYRAP